MDALEMASRLTLSDVSDGENAAGENGSYINLEPDKIYTVASHNYLIQEGGDGLNMFMDNELLVDGGMLDYQILMTYLTDYLGGTVGNEYTGPQGRITVE